MPKPIKARAKERLQRALDAIPGLKQAKYDSPEFEKWERDTKVAIDYAFEGSPSKTQDFAAIRYSPFAFMAGATSDFQRPYVRGLESAAAVLQSMIEEIEEYWEEDGDQEPTSSKVPEILERTNTNEVFMIHGRDRGTRDTVTRFLEGLGIAVVILEEQPNQGRTVIEKFEKCAQGDFAIALFTPDDVGGSNDDDPQPRTRQNVIFELGYFIGKFGRDRVCALTEIPQRPAGRERLPRTLPSLPPGDHRPRRRGLAQGGPEALPPLRQSWVVVELELAHGIQKCTYSPRQVPHYDNYPLSIERLYV